MYVPASSLVTFSKRSVLSICWRTRLPSRVREDAETEWAWYFSVLDLKKITAQYFSYQQLWFLACPWARLHPLLVHQSPDKAQCQLCPLETHGRWRCFQMMDALTKKWKLKVSILRAKEQTKYKNKTKMMSFAYHRCTAQWWFRHRFHCQNHSDKCICPHPACWHLWFSVLRSSRLFLPPFPHPQFLCHPCAMLYLHHPQLEHKRWRKVWVTSFSFFLSVFLEE